MLRALPPDAVMIHSADTSMVSLVGLYIDSDGIVYNPDGNVNEAATALAIRAAITAQVAQQNVNAPAPWMVEQQSVQDMSDAARTATTVNMTVDNILSTLESIPGRVYDTVASAVPTVSNVAKWAVIGLVAYAVIQVADRVPSQGHVKRYVRRRVREYRQRAAKYVAGD